MNNPWCRKANEVNVETPLHPLHGAQPRTRVSMFWHTCANVFWIFHPFVQKGYATVLNIQGGPGDRYLLFLDICRGARNIWSFVPSVALLVYSLITKSSLKGSWSWNLRTTSYFFQTSCTHTAFYRWAFGWALSFAASKFSICSADGLHISSENSKVGQFNKPCLLYAISEHTVQSNQFFWPWNSNEISWRFLGVRYENSITSPNLESLTPCFFVKICS